MPRLSKNSVSIELGLEDQGAILGFFEEAVALYKKTENPRIRLTIEFLEPEQSG